MGARAKSSSNLAGRKEWDGRSVEAESLDLVVEILRAQTRPGDVMALARGLAEALAPAASVPADALVRVKKYDHRCDFQEGERVYVDNRYGRSLATVTSIIRQPETAFCDKAFLEFDDAQYRRRWEAERSTPYFAINSGRVNQDPTFVEVAADAAPAAPRSRMNATALAKFARTLEAKLEADPRFAKAPEGWYLADGPRPVSRPHISAEPGGAIVAALPQGCYKAPVLDAIDKLGEATIEDVKRGVQSTLKLGPADWETDPTGKIVWIHRLHAAIKHLKRVGAIDSPRREVYRRARALQKESA